MKIDGPYISIGSPKSADALRATAFLNAATGPLSISTHPILPYGSYSTLEGKKNKLLNEEIIIMPKDRNPGHRDSSSVPSRAY
jgi:hypothetical protein